MDTHTLTTPDATLVYDVRGPIPTADGRPPLFCIGHPMDAGGFASLASYLTDRTVVTYDPRGLGRSEWRALAGTPRTPQDQAADVHAVIADLGAGPVELFGSSGGAVVGLALVAAHPEDVTRLVAHEPPLLNLLPDAGAATKAFERVTETYHQKGWGHGMAAFVAMTSWQGEYTDDLLTQPLPDPAMFGMPSDDDGRRDDPLLSGVSAPISGYEPDFEAVAAAPTRTVIAVGVESEGLLTGRTSVATAERLGQEVVLFPSHHGGFMGGEHGYAGQPEAFAQRLAEVLAQG